MSWNLHQHLGLNKYSVIQAQLLSNHVHDSHRLLSHWKLVKALRNSDYILMMNRREPRLEFTWFD
jgi:hypothetical protein